MAGVEDLRSLLTVFSAVLYFEVCNIVYSNAYGVRNSIQHTVSSLGFNLSDIGRLKVNYPQHFLSNVF